MKLKLLIAVEDKPYALCVSNYISEKYSSSIDVSVCTNVDHLGKATASKRFDAALMDSDFMENITSSAIHLPILLADSNNSNDSPDTLPSIFKYQRISSIVADIFEMYSKLSKRKQNSEKSNAYITAVWSPSGGVGKTTVSLTQCASVAASGKKAFYLNLEYFSSIPAYFSNSGKSISNVFEMLDNSGGDVGMLIQGISSFENNISYLSSPNNYTDMNVLSSENLIELISACCGLADEIIIDLPAECNSRTEQIFKLANTIIIITDGTETSEAKLSQFLNQSNIFENIRDKSLLVVNKGASVNEELSSLFSSIPVSLPLIPHDDERVVYKELSAYID